MAENDWILNRGWLAAGWPAGRLSNWHRMHHDLPSMKSCTMQMRLQLFRWMDAYVKSYSCMLLGLKIEKFIRWLRPIAATHSRARGSAISTISRASDRSHDAKRASAHMPSDRYGCANLTLQGGCQ